MPRHYAGALSNLPNSGTTACLINTIPCSFLRFGHQHHPQKFLAIGTLSKGTHCQDKNINCPHADDSWAIKKSKTILGTVKGILIGQITTLKGKSLKLHTPEPSFAHQPINSETQRYFTSHAAYQL